MNFKFYRITILGLAIISLALVISCNSNANTDKVEEQLDLRTEEKPAEPQVRKAMSAGERTFLLCTACHTLKKGEPNKVGPNLYGIMGRKAASLENFTYSEALTNSGIVWNEDRIREWLTKPTDYVPGTTMAFIGLKNKEQQDILIEYVKEETQE